MWTVFIALLFLAAPFLIFAGPAASDPTVVDNPDDTGYLIWDFSSMDNYTMTNTEMDEGLGMLDQVNESSTQDSYDDFSTGDMANIDATTWPGYMALDSTENSCSVTIQPAADVSKDTYLAQDRDDDNYGQDKELRLDSEISKKHHIILAFDTSSIPSNAVIEEAVVYIWQISGGKSTPVDYTVHSLTVGFTEDGASWLMNDSASGWAVPGGDFDPYPYASGTLPYVVGWYGMEISKLVEKWVKDPGENKGIIIFPIPVGGDAVKLFQSSDQTSNPQYAPKLTINYTIQGGMGVYESEPMGPGTNSTFTLCEWSSGLTSRLNDEFSGTALSSKWTWFNDPADGGGAYNVGVTTPGKLHVVGESNAQNLNTNIGSNYLHQNVVGEFEATVSLSDSFTLSAMGAGILLVESPMEWISVAKADPGTSGKILVTSCVAGVSTVVKNYDWTGLSNAYLKMIRNSTGIWILASQDGGSFVEVYNQTSAKMMMSLDIGLFVYSNSASTPVVDFDYFRVVPVSYLPLEMRIRTGNSTSFADPSWEAWGSAILGPSVVLGVDSKYLQYRAYFETDYSWYTPSFDSFTCHDERYLPVGYIESEDVVPADFSMWYTLTTVDDHTSGAVRYWYSYDHGLNWIYAGTGGSYSISSTIQSLRIRVGLETYDTLSTPTVDSVTAVFGTALIGMYVVAPEKVVAGQYFEVMIYAKDSSNTTMVHWSGPVNLTATDSYGLGAASGVLTVGTAYITSGGYVTVANERYFMAETIRIRASAQGIYGYSDLIQVVPGPVATIVISPDISEVFEHSSNSFSAMAYDGYGNTISNASFTWSVDPSIGSLSSTTGSSVTFTAGEYATTGEITVATNGVSTSKEISVVRTAHNPAFTGSMPVQDKEEDCESWELDITSYIYDEYHLTSELRWYTTNESLVTVSGENKTGNMVITFIPKADAWGVNDLKLFLVDQEGLSGSTTVKLNITPVNDGPTIDDIDPLVVHYDMVYLYNLKYYIHDVDNTLDELTVRVDYMSEEHVDVEKQTLAIQYPMVLNGTIQTIFVTVTDGDLSASTTIFVSVTDDNVPISLDVLPTVELYQGESSLNLFDLDDYFIDPDDEMLYYAYGYQHVSLEINPGNEVSFFAPFDWYGEEYVIFKATDPRGARVESVALVKVLHVNQPPKIEDVPNLTVKAGERYEFDLTRYITDPDNNLDALNVQTDDYHAVAVGLVLSILYPTEMLGETVQLNISVSDGELLDWTMINVTISDDSPPTALPLPKHTFHEDRPTMFPATGSIEDYFYDYEGQETLAYDVFSSSEQVTMEVGNDGQEDRVVIFHPENNFYGVVMFTIRATDSTGGIAESTTELTIISVPDAPMMYIPTNATLQVGERLPFDLSPYVYDPDTDMFDMVFTVTGEGSEYITVTGSVLMIEFPVNYILRSDSSVNLGIIVIVADSEGLTDSTMLRITVYKSASSLDENPWMFVAMLIMSGSALGFFMIAMGMRKRPFEIRDMMLIHNDGFLIGRAIEGRQGEIDEDVLSGMLTAVLNFVEDSMASSQDSLKSFGFAEYKVLVQRGKMTYVAVVFTGDAPDDIERALEEFLVKIEKIYRKRIENWTGDMDVDFAGIGLLLEGFVNDHSKAKNHSHDKKGDKDWVVRKPKLPPPPED